MAIFKQAIKGIIISIVAAYLYVALIVLFDMATNPQNRESSVFNVIAIAFGAVPVWALFVYSWFVIPAGAIVAVTIAYATRRYSRRRAIWRGIIVGLVLGLVAAFLLNVFDALPMLRANVIIPDRSLWWTVFWKRVAFAALNLCVYCALWTGAYAYLGARSRSARAAPVT